MKRKSSLARWIVALVLALPLLAVGVAAAESGCHRGQGAPVQTPPGGH